MHTHTHAAGWDYVWCIHTLTHTYPHACTCAYTRTFYRMGVFPLLRLLLPAATACCCCPPAAACVPLLRAPAQAESPELFAGQITYILQQLHDTVQQLQPVAQDVESDDEAADDGKWPRGSGSG